jgi:hypothetical protein
MSYGGAKRRWNLNGFRIINPMRRAPTEGQPREAQLTCTEKQPLVQIVALNDALHCHRHGTAFYRLIRMDAGVATLRL